MKKVVLNIPDNIYDLVKIYVRDLKFSTDSSACFDLFSKGLFIVTVASNPNFDFWNEMCEYYGDPPVTQ